MTIEEDFELLRNIIHAKRDWHEPHADAALSRIERDREDWKLAAGAEAEIADEFKRERDALKAALEEIREVIKTQLSQPQLWGIIDQALAKLEESA